MRSNGGCCEKMVNHSFERKIRPEHIMDTWRLPRNCVFGGAHATRRCGGDKVGIAEKRMMRDAPLSKARNRDKVCDDEKKKTEAGNILCRDNGLGLGLGWVGILFVPIFSEKKSIILSY